MRLRDAVIIIAVGVGVIIVMTVIMMSSRPRVTTSYDTTTSTVGTTVTPRQIDIHTSDYCSPR